MKRISYAERKSLPNVTAVYIVKAKEIALYVGSTLTLRTRLMAHHKRDAFAYNNATSIEWLEVEEDDLAEKEKEFVRTFKPTLNSVAARAKPYKKQKRKASSHKLNFLTSWRDECISLFNERPVSLLLSTIAKDMGVSLAWLRMFGRGEILNPGVCTIETLIEYLKNHNKKAG